MERKDYLSLAEYQIHAQWRRRIRPASAAPFCRSPLAAFFFFLFLFKVKAFDAAPPFVAAAVEFGVFVCLFIYLPALRRAAFVRPPPRSRSAERERLNILFDGLEPERF